MAEKTLDRIVGKEIPCLIIRLGENYVVFEFNKKEVKGSVVSPEGKLFTSYKMNHDPSFNIKDTNVMNKLAEYLLVNLSRNYRGIL